MAYIQTPTVATGDLWTAAQHNTYLRDNLNAIWVGTTTGDLDYYSSPTAKTRIAIGAASKTFKSRGGIPAWDDPVGCVVYGNGNYNVANNSVTETSVFDTEVVDSDGYHSSIDGSITIPAGLGGLYLITFQGYFAGHASAGTCRQIGIKINSALGPYVNSVQDAGSQATWMVFSFPKKLNAGDVIKGLMFQLSTATIAFYYPTMGVIKIA